MKIEKQKGFSLIELLVVVTIIGTVSAIAVPMLKRAIIASENGNTFATTKVMLQEQFNFYSQNARYARLDELNARYGNGFGSTVNNEILRGKFTFAMSPANPSDADLRQNFEIIATRTLDNAEVPYVLSIDATGEAVQILP
mgnify:CR=1 FL=1|jgi:prepilin-type N-terminal cleavage/methylation domain-containing protein